MYNKTKMVWGCVPMSEQKLIKRLYETQVEDNYRRGIPRKKRRDGIKEEAE